MKKVYLPTALIVAAAAFLVLINSAKFGAPPAVYAHEQETDALRVSAPAPEFASIDRAEVTTPPETAPDETEPPQSYNGIYEGDIFKGTLTYYDVCVKCCGKTDGITASGIVIQNGIEPETGICGCNWLPLMTLIEIDGVPFIVADRGGSSLNKVGRLDVFNPAGHEDCIQKGVKCDAEIIIIKLPEE